MKLSFNVFMSYLNQKVDVKSKYKKDKFASLNFWTSNY